MFGMPDSGGVDVAVPGHPRRPFASLGQARAWVHRFVTWYNQEHRHSALRFLTPAQRHAQ
ncbi:integrase core domain-containing protein [Achromobacter denitrificans]